VSQVGQSEFAGDPPVEYTREGVLESSFIPLLGKHGFEKVKGYEEMHGGFMGVWDFLIAFKDSSALENWYGSQAMIDLQTTLRIRPTISGESSLLYFDGATMKTLEFPSRLSENVFCLKEDPPPFCSMGHGFDPERPKFPATSFEVKESNIPGAGWGLFAKEDILKGGYMVREQAVHNMLILPGTRAIMKAIELNVGSENSPLDVFKSYFYGYGWATDFFGAPSFEVDSGVLTFQNHGCNRTYNVGFETSVTELTADPEKLPPELDEKSYESVLYNPFVDRNYLYITNSLEVLRDIKAGEECLDNFLAFLHDENWKWGVENYKSMCENPGDGAGVVSAYQLHNHQNVDY